jgi:hypothetical protein
VTVLTRESQDQLAYLHVDRWPARPHPPGRNNRFF